MIFKSSVYGQTGAIMIMVAVAIVVIFGFCILCLDMPMTMLVKSQLQNAADAAALAGALAYAHSNGDEATAIAEAIQIAGLNNAVRDRLSPVVITPDDISFPGNNQVHVRTHRTRATGDPISMHFLKIIDPSSDNMGEMTATATAQVFTIEQTFCVQPWAFPDSFYDANSNGVFDNASDRYDASTSYQSPRDLGHQITLSMINPSGTKWRQKWAYPFDFYYLQSCTWNSSWFDCVPNMYDVSLGDSLVFINDPSPAQMSQMAYDKLHLLLTEDPVAYWDNATKTVMGSHFLASPRIVKVPLIDPQLSVLSNNNPRGIGVVKKFAALFLTQVTYNSIYGIFIQEIADGEQCINCSPEFLNTVALVQ
jgi:Flp pilus assembly protein TadG